jgi:F0F1-type ATP synthase assembly protein I
MNKWKMYAEVSGAALTLFASVLIGLFVGQWLDQQFAIQGIFTVIMIFLGLLGGIIALYRVIKKYDDNEQ